MRANRIRLTFESLEKREMLAADVSLGQLGVAPDASGLQADSALVAYSASESFEASTVDSATEEEPVEALVDEVFASPEVADDLFADAEGEFVPTEELLPVQTPIDPFRRVTEPTQNTRSAVLVQPTILPIQTPQTDPIAGSLRVFDYAFEDDEVSDSNDEQGDSLGEDVGDEWDGELNGELGDDLNGKANEKTNGETDHESEEDQANQMIDRAGDEAREAVDNLDPSEDEIEQDSQKRESAA
ncbi:MAG: hypothetical protein AAGG48_27180 [Planctomycetota bacterium]